MPQSKFLTAALKAADWFVNSQVTMKRPQWDANHGRFIYTYCIPAKLKILGLSWTQGRGIITELAAWEATGDGKYLKSAIQAGEYIKHLQIMDPRDPRTFGIIREEVPGSWYMNTRDGLEAALGLLYLHRATGDGEWLHRARVFGDWFLSQAFDEKSGWAPASVSLAASENPHLPGHSFCLGGGIYFFALLAKATGDSKYLDRAFRPMARRLADEYVRDSDGAILVSPKSGRGDVRIGHHEVGDRRYAGLALNDDACGLSVLVAHRELGEARYLDLATKYGELMLRDEYPLPAHAAGPLRALTLAELSRATGEEKYAAFAAGRIAPTFLPSQVGGTGDPDVDGAFRGEDEDPGWYGPKGAGPLDFVNTRVTAYAASALFKLDGTVFGPYYSAWDWEKPARKPAAELLRPYRI